MPRLPSGAVLAAPLALMVLSLAPAPAGAATTAGPSDAKLGSIVRTEASCLAALRSPDRTLLTLRFGRSGTSGVPATTAAARLHTTLSAFTTAELGAIRRLEAAHRGGNCPVTATTTVPAHHKAVARQGVQAFHASRPASVSATATSSGLSWTSPTELVLLAVIALALCALLYGLRRDLGRPRHARLGGSWVSRHRPGRRH